MTKPSWRDKPFWALDTETTGVDPETARLITAALVYVEPGGKSSTRNWLADPGVEIDNSDIHGITTEYAQTHGEPIGDILLDIAAALQTDAYPSGGALVLFNANYDLTVLDREMRRNLKVPLPEVPSIVVDPFVIDKKISWRKGSRRLKDQCTHYGIELTEADAHTAAGDALASARLAWKLASHRSVPRDLAKLHAVQQQWQREQALSYAGHLRRPGPKQDLDKAEDVERSAGHWPLRPLPVTAEPATR